MRFELMHHLTLVMFGIGGLLIAGLLALVFIGAD